MKNLSNPVKTRKENWLDWSMKNFQTLTKDGRRKLKDLYMEKSSRFLGRLLTIKDLLKKNSYPNACKSKCSPINGWLKVFTHQRVKNRDKKTKSWVNLAFLLVPLLFGRPRFCLIAPLGLIVGLIIGKAISMEEDVTVSFSKFSW